MCTQNSLQKILGIVTERMKGLFGEKLCSIVLFGSYARGDFEDESDLDVFVMVDMDAETLASYRSEISRFSSRIALEYDILLSVILQDKRTFDKWQDTLPFFINVKREGVSVYAA